MFKSKFHAKIKEESQQKRIQKDQEFENKALMHERKQNYGKIIKEEYMPPRSMAKINELEEQKAKIAMYNKRKPYLQEHLQVEGSYL